MTYVIRSMSTTDYAPQYGQYPKPYHLYLLPEAERKGAFWSASGARQRFSSWDEAFAYARKLMPGGKYGYQWQVVPADDRRFPTYWESRNPSYGCTNR